MKKLIPSAHPSVPSTTGRFFGAIVIGAALMLARSASAALVFTEEYPTAYGDGTALGNNDTTGGYSTKWGFGNGTGTGNPICTNAAALSYAPLQPISGSASYGFLCATAGSRDQSAGFTSQSGDGNSVYVSFLIQVTAATPVARNLLGLRNSTGGGTLVAAVGIDASRQLTLFKSGTAAATTTAALNQNQTYFVVLRYKFVTGSGTDECALWLNPATGGAGEANAGVTPIITATGSDQNGLLSIRLPSVTDASGPLYLDEIRIGSTWADVTPAGGPLVGQQLGFTTQPANAAPGATMNPVVVQVQASGGASVASNNVPVTLTLTSGSGTLSGTLTQNTDASGKATFNNLSIDQTGVKQLTASASGIGAGLTSVVSSNFSIIAPSVGTKLAFTTQPANALVNATLNSVVVQVQDASSVSVASNAVPVTLTLSSGSGVLNGTVTQNTDATGKATFSTLSIDTVGTGKQLTASASGIGAGLANAVSGAFSITNSGGGGGIGALVITQSLMTASGFVVNGTDGGSNLFCQILGSTDLSVVKSNWVIVSYQNSDANGRVSFTNPISPAMPYAFYALRTGDTTTKLQPPSIGIQPASQIVSPGSTAIFSVTAVGPALQYLWYFNGNPITGATSSTLTINNAQAANAGSYYVIVANPAGNVTSATATLGVGNVGPSITSQPQNQTNTSGGTAIFVVGATGTSPLHFQWYFNTNTLVTDATNTVLTKSNLSTNDAGKYRVIVSNNYGTATSVDATLVVTPVPTALPDTNMVGWAAFANVTGGAGGTEVTNSDYASFRASCRATGPIIIHVQGAITPNESYCYVEGRDKTIIGIGTNAALLGDLRLAGTNIIVQNMYFSATNANSDGITIDNSSHGTGRNVWVDHCTFFACTDGSLDITKGADYITVSWCKFSYEPVPAGVVNHEFVHLIGSSDSDSGVNFHVTFHHNWYSDYCRERMPSVRFGRVHVFNNYYSCVGNNYCVRTRIDAEVLVENNYFLGVQNPWERFVTTGSPGLLKATGNITNNCNFVNGWVTGAVVIPGTDTLGSDLNPPPYTQSPFYYPPLTQAADVPYYIQTYSGSGKYPYVP